MSQAGLKNLRLSAEQNDSIQAYTRDNSTCLNTLIGCALSKYKDKPRNKQ